MLGQNIGVDGVGIGVLDIYKQFWFYEIFVKYKDFTWKPF